MTVVAESRYFMLHSDGRIEEVDDEGDTYDFPSDPTLYETLVLAGFPLHSDEQIRTFDGVLDLAVTGDRVVANAKPAATDMGLAGELFLAWLRDND